MVKLFSTVIFREKKIAAKFDVPTGYGNWRWNQKSKLIGKVRTIAAVKNPGEKPPSWNYAVHNNPYFLVILWCLWFAGYIGENYWSGCVWR